LWGALRERSGRATGRKRQTAPRKYIYIIIYSILQPKSTVISTFITVWRALVVVVVASVGKKRGGKKTVHKLITR